MAMTALAVHLHSTGMHHYHSTSGGLYQPEICIYYIGKIQGRVSQWITCTVIGRRIRLEVATTDVIQVSL